MSLTVSMPSVQMPAQVFRVSESRDAYRSVGALSMLGQWQLEVRVLERVRVMAHTFTLNLRLPAALARGEGERRAIAATELPATKGSVG